MLYRAFPELYYYSIPTLGHKILIYALLYSLQRALYHIGSTVAPTFLEG